MNLKLVTHNTAKLAKEKGYNWEDNCYYFNGEAQYWSAYINYNNKQLPNQELKQTAPTQSLLEKWLRDTYNIHIEISYSFEYKKYMFVVHSKPNERLLIEIGLLDQKPETYLKYDTHEEALEIALQDGLQRIE